MYFEVDDVRDVYRAVNLPQLDQNEMVAIRTAWFEEVGGAPTGNKCASSSHFFFFFNHYYE